MQINETRLRRWLKRIWETPDILSSKVEWHEAGVGGTVGAPDCVIRIGDTSYGVELKHWSLDKSENFKASIRPAQVKYHTMASVSGAKTVFIVQCETKLGVEERYIFQGKHIYNSTLRKSLKDVSQKITCRGDIVWFLTNVTDWSIENPARR